MNKEKITEIKVGATVIIAIIIFIFIYGWANNYSFSSEKNKLLIQFPSVAGLELGDIATINGVKKGYVTLIKTNNNTVLVEVEFNSNVELNEDADFQIMMLDLMGGKKIEIYPGVSQQPINFSEIQSGKFAGDVATAMAALSSVQSDLIAVIEDLRKTLTIVNKVVSEDDFINNFKNTVLKLDNITQNLSEIIVDNKGNFRESIKNIKNITENTYKFLSKNSNVIDSSFTNLNFTLSESKQLFSKINKLVSEIENKENNIGKIIYDKELVNDLKISLTQLKKLTTTINKQLNSEGLKVKADVDIF
ncbi:MAG: ABC transporter substrate-binding protein [Ignavibacteriae bacterium]|nr:MAG: ABC transporter substrate-binding protein [Ignavibacteriota bacterium]